MASVRQTQTPACRDLDFALGEKRINLGDLSESEFDEFFKKVLGDICPREIRGFSELKDVISVMSSPDRNRNTDLNNLSISEDVVLSAKGFSDGTCVDLKTHILKLCRGFVRQKFVFKQLETGETRTDREAHRDWRDTGILLSGERSVLAIRRPRNHSRADECLVVVSFKYSKLQCKKRHIVETIEIQNLPLSEFRQYFGKKYPHIAKELILELNTALRRTVDDLELQARIIHNKAVAMSRLSDVITYR